MPTAYYFHCDGCDYDVEISERSKLISRVVVRGIRPDAIPKNVELRLQSPGGAVINVAVPVSQISVQKS